MKYKITYVIDEQGLDDAVGLELVSLSNEQSDSEREVYSTHQFKMVKREGNLFTFEAEIEPSNAGTYRSCVRMYPKNDLLPHRQDFAYVKWLD